MGCHPAGFRVHTHETILAVRDLSSFRVPFASSVFRQSDVCFFDTRRFGVVDAKGLSLCFFFFIFHSFSLVICVSVGHAYHALSVFHVHSLAS